MTLARDRPRVPPSFQSFAALFVCMMAVVERCGLLPEVAVAVLLTFFAVALMTNTHMNEVRCSVLGDQTSTWRFASVCNGLSTLNVVSMLRLCGPARKNDEALLAATEQLRHTAREHGGQVNYVGRAIHVAVKSKQLSDAQEFDVVVLSSWVETGQGGWASFRQVVDSECGWERHVACGYWRNPVVNFAVVVALVLLRLKCGLRGVYHNVAHPATATHDGDEVQTQMDKLAKKLDALGSAKAGVLVCNCLNDDFRPGRSAAEAKSDKAIDRSYSQNMMEMLGQHGGGPLHLGRVASLKTVETGAFNDGEWKHCACVYYPGCAFFCQLLRSEWMQRVVKGKAPGDSIAVVTVPFRPDTQQGTVAGTSASVGDHTSSDRPKASVLSPLETGVRRRKFARTGTSNDEPADPGAKDAKLLDAEPKLVSVPPLAVFQLVVVLWLFRQYA